MPNYKNLTIYKQEDFLEIEILKYLQKFQQSASRSQLAEYLITNVEAIPNDSLKVVISKKTGRPYQPFMNRLSFALTSLYKARLIDRPQRGISELTELGKTVNTSNTQYIHQLVMEGWKNNETTSTTD